MNAEQARELTDNALKNNSGIEKFLKSILQQIELAAGKGENVLKKPFSYCESITYEQQELVIKAMKNKGYKYTRSKGQYHDYDPAFFSW